MFLPRRGQSIQACIKSEDQERDTSLGCLYFIVIAAWLFSIALVNRSCMSQQ